MSFKIPLIKPFTGTEELDSIRKVLESGFLTQGKVVKEFESVVSSFVGTKYGVATTSCTTAMQVALGCIGIGNQDEVIVPDFTFPATANVVTLLGGTPVLVDVDPQTGYMLPEEFERSVNNRTKALIIVHPFGHPADMDPIVEIANKHEIVVIEDAATSLGSTYKGRQTGSIGKIGCFSFHPRKLVTTGEGGMLVTNDKEIAHKASILRNHGQIESDSHHDRFIEAGYNFRMTDIQAAIGLVQMSRLNKIIETRRELAKAYLEMLNTEQIGAKPIEEKEWAKTNYQSYVTIIENSKVSRDDWIKRLKAYQIETQIGTYALHMQPSFANVKKVGNLANSTRLYLNTLTLPMYHQMSYEEQKYVIDAMHKIKS